MKKILFALMAALTLAACTSKVPPEKSEPVEAVVVTIDSTDEVELDVDTISTDTIPADTIVLQ